MTAQWTISCTPIKFLKSCIVLNGCFILSVFVKWSNEFLIFIEEFFLDTPAVMRCNELLILKRTFLNKIVFVNQGIYLFLCMHAQGHQKNKNGWDSNLRMLLIRYTFLPSLQCVQMFLEVQNCPLNGTKLEGTMLYLWLEVQHCTLQGTTPVTATCTLKGTVLYLSFWEWRILNILSWFPQKY